MHANADMNVLSTFNGFLFMLLQILISFRHRYSALHSCYLWIHSFGPTLLKDTVGYHIVSFVLSI